MRAAVVAAAAGMMEWLGESGLAGRLCQAVIGGPRASKKRVARRGRAMGATIGAIAVAGGVAMAGATGGSAYGLPPLSHRR